MTCDKSDKCCQYGCPNLIDDRSSKTPESKCERLGGIIGDYIKLKNSKDTPFSPFCQTDIGCVGNILDKFHWAYCDFGCNNTSTSPQQGQIPTDWCLEGTANNISNTQRAYDRLFMSGGFKPAWTNHCYNLVLPVKDLIKLGKPQSNIPSINTTNINDYVKNPYNIAWDSAGCMD